MAPKKSPAIKRATKVQARPAGRATGSAVSYMLARFQMPESREEFMAWRLNPVTAVMVDVLREMAMTLESPVAELNSDPLVEYGITQGLSLGACLMDDPSSVYNWLFTDPTLGRSDEMPPVEYTAAPDGDPSGQP